MVVAEALKMMEESLKLQKRPGEWRDSSRETFGVSWTVTMVRMIEEKEKDEIKRLILFMDQCSDTMLDFKD